MTQQERYKDLSDFIDSNKTIVPLRLQDEVGIVDDFIEFLSEHYDFTPKFKKLEWGITGNIQENCYSINEKYYITFDNEVKTYSAFRISAANFTELGSNTDLQKSKDLCQEDYEKEVLNNII
jgi:hypothetical protein